MKRIYFLLLALFSFFSIEGQNLFFNHLDVKDGLSHSTVQSIYQDEYGQIWFATRNGLNKYDGNTVERINIKVDGLSDFFFNDIMTVTGDGKGKIYIQSMQMLIIFDTLKQTFTTKGARNVRTIYYADNKVWIGATNKLSYLADGSTEVKEYLALEDKTNIHSILHATDGSLYIGTNKNVIKVSANFKQKVIVDGINVTSFYEDSKHQIWIGTLSNGLFLYKKDEQLENIRSGDNEINGLTSNFVRCIVEDNLGNYWIGTYAGLNYLNYDKKHFANYTHSPNEPHSISDFSVHAIMKDMQGTLWIGTNFGGANYINPEFSFDQYYNSESGLSSEIVSNVSEDSSGNLWICTDDAGLIYFNRSNNIFKHIKHSASNSASLTSNALKASLIDVENNCLWIGSNLGGLDKIDLTTHRVERMPLRTNNPDIDLFVRAIIKYGDKLILGTHNSAQLYDIKNKTISPILPESHSQIRQVWDMILDSSNNLWLSSAPNIYCVDMKTKEVRDVHKEIGENFLSVFLEDSKKNIWIGTAGQGLFCYKPTINEFEYFNTDNSKIIDNYILDIAESPSGALLLTTNAGLSRYDKDKNTFSNYFLNQFFPFKAFNERSLYVTKKGEIMLCSFNGMMIINEEDLNISPKPYTLNFTDLSINNKLVSPNDETKILKASIYQTDTIVLQERHTIFSIDVFVNNYLSLINSQIHYKLDRFDDQWVNLKSKRTISYTNLKPKTYTLMVYATDNFSGFTTPTKELTIIVEPYFYKTWYAYLFYFLLFIGMLYVFISRIFFKNSLKYAQYKAAHIQEVNESKMRFFINVSHEIRTPITLIMAQIEYLLGDKYSSTTHNRLLNMKRNAQKLRDLVNELLDFRKQEAGLMTLNIEEVEIVRYLKNILHTFKEYGESLHIASKFASEIEDCNMYFDSVQMDKVFYNLLSNAFKYTPEDGEVSVSIIKGDENITIEVADTGIGIKSENINEIFNRFYQVEDKESKFTPRTPGTGIGLSLVKNIIELHHGSILVSSRESIGSVFKVIFPMGVKHFDEDKNIRFVKKADTNTIEEIKENGNKKLDEISSDVKSDQEILIYIVEDNDDIRNILLDIFTPLYRVKSFANAESAYEEIKDDMPNLVLLDVMLPMMSGVELCSKIKTNLATLHIPVVLLTAATGSNERIEGLLKGADDYISKPFDIHELIVRCNNLIRSRQSLGTLPKAENTQAQGVNNKDKEFISELESIIKQNIDSSALNVDMLASKMNIARTALFTRLREIAATTPNKLILDIRMATALEIIKSDKDIMINEVAYQIGFHTPSYFINVFKTHYGVTPNEFRKSYFKLD